MAINTANVTTVTGNVYVSTGNTAVTFLSLCNFSVANVTANLHVVPNGDTAGNVNLVLASLDIEPGDTYQFYVGNEKLLLTNGDSIQASVSSNAAVACLTSFFVSN